MTIGTAYDTYQPYGAYQSYGMNPSYAANPSDEAAQPYDSSTRFSGKDLSNSVNPLDPKAKTAAEKADPDEQKKAGRKSSPAECETCKTRKYQDGSDENVSFKSAAHISPQAAGAAVRAHENEHVSNAYTKAAENNGEVLSATVSIHMAVCPECGRSYVSGGETNTMIKYTNESNPYQKELKRTDAARLRGAHLDLSA